MFYCPFHRLPLAKQNLVDNSKHQYPRDCKKTIPLVSIFSEAFKLKTSHCCIYVSVSLHLPPLAYWSFIFLRRLAFSLSIQVHYYLHKLIVLQLGHLGMGESLIIFV